jgi:hypothetical protein
MERLFMSPKALPEANSVNAVLIEIGGNYGIGRN